jgi:hypothetical protein
VPRPRRRLLNTLTAKLLLADQALSAEASISTRYQNATRYHNNMKAFGKWAGAAAALVSGVAAASYDDIAPIEVYGQHFFYTNNGSQLYVDTLGAIVGTLTGL